MNGDEGASSVRLDFKIKRKILLIFLMPIHLSYGAKLFNEKDKK